MKLELEVLAFTNIKRRKPWPKIIWIGQEQESLLLLDPQSHRISVLYVPSGKTKRQIPRLSPLIDEIHCFSFTKNRCFLLGLLWTGNLFVWYKDKDILKQIPGPPNVADQSDWLSDRCALAASDDLKHVFLVLGTSQYFIWEMNKGESLIRSREQELKGTWHALGVPSGVPIPTVDCRECSFDVVFFSSQVLGECCQYSMVFNQGRMLKMATVLIRFNQAPDVQPKSHQVFSKEWSLLEYPFQQIHPEYEPIMSQGAYVCSYSSNGHILAVAANQNQADHTSMLFVSPLTDTVLATGMKGCGVKDSRAWGRQVWVVDLAWTSDSLFVACILKSGSVCILTRLGEPVVVKAEGCTVNMGPSYYLPLHPALMISGYDGAVARKDGSVKDPMGQQFSVSSHPYLPIVLFSDGFVVTLVQLPVDMTCTTLMRDLVLESTRHLRKVTEQENLDISLADAYKLSKSKGLNKARKNFVFEENKNLNATQDSEASIIEEDEKFSQLGILDNLDAGKIVFGQPELIPINLDKTFTGLNASESLLKHLEEAQTSLFTAWKLAASFADTWTSDVDNVAKQTTNNITKVFIVILDCPAVDAVIPVLTPQKSSTIQNPRVYNVLSAYKQYLQILRFDMVNQHLLPVILRLVHQTVNLMLESKELEKMDPRLKTLLGCYSILGHARSVLNRIYTWVPAGNQSIGLPQDAPVQADSGKRFEPAVLTRVQKCTGNNVAAGVDLDSQGHLPGRRLCATWKLLYKHLLRHQKSLGESVNVDPRELDQLTKLIFSVQQTLQEVDGEITPRRAAKITSGDKLSVDGEHTLAVEAWKDQLKNITDKDPKIAHTLHSVLYTYLLKGELAKAVDFVDSLILQANVRKALSAEDLPEFDAGMKPPLMTLVTHTLRSQNSEEEELVPCIRNKAIRQVVQSMARFMASYFSNQTLFIYPPHNAQALPSIHMGDTSVNNRIIPKYHEDITGIITRDGLSSIWTTERTVEYLLLSGLVCEMTWFAHKLGDWKTAYLLAVAHHNHKLIAPHLYKRAKKPLQLPASLSPESILQGKLQALVSIIPPASPTRKQNKRSDFIPITEETNFPQLTSTLENILTAGLVCGVELAPWLLDSLVEKVKAIIANFPPLVPQDFYLPAPPLFCPQPAKDTGILPPDVEFEKQLRMEVSSLVQLILVVLNSTRLSLPLARWYIQELAKVQEKAAQFKATTEGPCMELPEVLQHYKMFQSSVGNFKDRPNVTKLMGSFRDICTILWLLHVRDKLSQHLRQRGKKMISKEELHRDNNAHMPQESAEASQEGVRDCFTTLQWAVHMLAFSKYLPDEECLHKVVLSLILELPAKEDTADILAEYFHDVENLEPEVQEKLDRLLNNWKSVEIVPENHGKLLEDGEEVEEEGDGEVRKSVTFFQASPRTIALSVYFHKQCQVVSKVFKRKRKCFGNYEEFVFNPGEETEGTVHSSISFQYINGILVGSRPFETKQSFLEFLDTLFAISFTKIVQEETRQGRNVKYPLILPFASEIKEKEFESYPLKNLDGSQKRPTSVVKSSPRAKFLRSQSVSHAFEEEEKQIQKNVKPRGLFRSNSSGDVIPSSIKSSRTSLADTENSPGREGKFKGGSSPSKAQAPNMTGLASKYYQSEEVLYRDPAESDDGHWVLDVNFGHNYLSLQRVLDWLYQWGSQHHALGLNWKGEKDLALRPTMRIEVPTQLVVLSLWLLEHKYSSVKRRKGSAGASPRVDQQPMMQQYLDVNERKARSKGLCTLEELTENESFKNVSDLRKSANSVKGKEEKTKRSMVTEDSLSSVTSLQMEDEETARVQTAYKHVLNGADDSSSLEVSSLGSEELDQQTLSLIKGFRRSSHKSPRRQSPSKESPDRRDRSTLNNTLHFQSSPERGNISNMAPNTSTPVSNKKKRKSRRADFLEEQNGVENIHEVSYSSSLQRSGVKVGGNPDHHHGNNPGYHDYADNPEHRLQDNPGNNPGHHNKNNSGHHHQGNPGHTPGNPGHNRRGSPKRSPSRGGNAGYHHDGGLSRNPGNNNGPENLSGLDIGQQLKYIIRGELRRMLQVQHQSMMAMMGALDETGTPWQPDQPANETIEQHLSRSPPDRTRGPMVDDELDHSQRPRHQKPNVREVLQELKILQKESVAENVSGKKGKKFKSPHGKIAGKENILEASLHVSDLQSASRSPQEIQLFQIRDGQEDVNLIPRFLRIPAEKDDGGLSFKLPKLPQEAWGQEKTERAKEEISRMPLLQMDENTKQIAHISSQHAPFWPLPLPQAGYFNSNVATKAAHISIGHHDVPLLQLPKENEQQGQSTFGKLLPPNMVVSPKQAQVEALRERMAQEFQEFLTYQTAQDEAMERQRFGGKLLHINFERVKTAEEEMERQMTASARTQQRERVPVETIPQKSTTSKPTAPRKKVLVISPGRTEKQVEGEVSEAKAREEKDETAGEDVPLEQNEGEEEEAEGELHDGYAIRPGAFENYLELEKELLGGAPMDTHARLQYLTALKLQQQRRKRQKVDFSTMTRELIDAGMETDVDMETESVRTAEAATSITKDTGVDPIQEAVIEYNRSRQGNALPPDIYMGLRFADGATQPATAGRGAARGRSYINVVDLDASAVMKDIEQRPETEETPGDELGLRPTSIMDRSLHDRDYETSLHDSYEQNIPVIPRPTREDGVTIRMFETRAGGQDSVSVAVMPRGSLPESKAATIRRLREMNQQIAAMDQMSESMVKEFKNTRLMLHTLETLDEAMKHEEKVHGEFGSEDEEDDQRTTSVKTGSLREASSTETLTPKQSQKSPTISARASARTKKSVTIKEDQHRRSDETRLSGLSGISDIIGEMVAKGDINLEEAGFTDAEAKRLVKKASISQREEQEEVTPKKLERKPLPGMREHKYDPEDLKEWIFTKRAERMGQYKQQLEELREREFKPYKQRPDVFDKTMSGRELEAEQNARQQSRRYLEKENLARRMLDAEDLLGDIISDKPKLPEEPQPRMSPKKKASRPKKDLSPSRTWTLERDFRPELQKPVPRKKPALKPQDYNEPSAELYGEEEDEYMTERDMFLSSRAISPVREEMRHKPIPVREFSPTRVTQDIKKPEVPKLKQSLRSVEEEHPLAETTDDLMEYTRAVQAMDVVESQEIVGKEIEKPKKPYKPKSFTELVRLQRPEITKKGRCSQIPMATEGLYTDRTTTVSQTETPTSREMTPREMKRIYGSKHLPGSRSTVDPSTRRVKTYAERLQEMKSTVTYSTPVAPRIHVVGSSVASESARTLGSVRRPVKPKHKPLTYVERLQKVNEGTHKPRAGPPTVVPRPVMRSHKPIHKPQTYTQQLKALQAPKQPPRAVSRAKKLSASRTAARARPYRDPYKEQVEDLDGSSVVSSWSMGDDVRKILYEDDISSIGRGTSYGRMSMASEQISDYYNVVMGEDYLHSVDVDEIARIADAASVSTGSVMSIIDWDAVDNLIADVR